MVVDVSRRQRQRLLTEVTVSSQNTFQNRDVLPEPFDDITRDYGIKIYEKMMLDSQVNSNIALFKASVIEEGLTIAPRVTSEEEDGFKKSKEIAEAANKMFEYMDSPLDDVLWNMMDHLVFGSKVAEQTYGYYGRESKQRLDLKYLKPVPLENTAFVVDQYNNVLGLLSRKKREGFILGAILDAKDIVPRYKFLIFTFRPNNSDPRGTSILRPAYEPWWRKRQIIPEYLKFLAQFASPSVIAKTPEGAASVPTDDDTEPLSPEEQLKNALLDFRNSSVLAVPHDTEVDFMEVKGDGEAFSKGITEANFDITKAILTQELATEQSRFQARAAAQVHQGILDTLIRQSKRAIVKAFKQDILLPWITYNWGEDSAYKLCPVVTLGTTEQRDLAPLMTAIASLERAGYVSDEQRADIDKLLGLPVRSRNEPKQMPISKPNNAAPSQPQQPQQQTQPPTPNENDNKDGNNA